MSIESNTNWQYHEISIIDGLPSSSIGPQITTYPWTYTYPTKSAREQVQDEILMKMAQAIEGDDLEKARELVKLAKALKEL